ncbi:hypothetical protein GS485_17530 [Rhodococcus hoagii]|nr:hypothetical protein [Prescottella equi]
MSDVLARDAGDSLIGLLITGLRVDVVAALDCILSERTVERCDYINAAQTGDQQAYQRVAGVAREHVAQGLIPSGRSTLTPTRRPASRARS